MSRKVLLLGLCVIVSWAFVNIGVTAIQPKMGVQFSQVDFTFDKAPWPNSCWGQLKVDIPLLVETTRIKQGYLNVFSSNGWHVINMPISGEDIEESRYEVTYFNLGLGDQAVIAKLSLTELERYLRIISQKLTTFSANVTFTEAPLSEIPKGEYISFPLEESVVWNSQGVSDLTITSINIPPAILAAWKADFTLRDYVYTEDHSVNVQTAYNQCFPMSIANSLQYLEDIFGLSIPNDHVMGLYGDNSLVGQLDQAAGRSTTSRTSGPGTWFTPMVKGKFTYLNRRELSDKLVQSYQGRGWGTAPDQALPAGDFTASGSTLVDKGDKVTFDWIREQIKNGEDVELVFSYDNSSGQATGGHAVRVFECGTIGGKPYIKYLHDRNQLNDSEGLETVQVFLEDLDSDGILNLGSVSREIRFAMSESIKEKPATPTATSTFQTSNTPTATMTSQSGVRPTATSTFQPTTQPTTKPAVTPTLQILSTPTPTATPTQRQIITRGLNPDDGIRFSQVDFLFEKAQWTNSSWGRMEVNPILLAEMTKIRAGFLNVFSEQGWQVTNMPISVADSTANSQTSTLTTYFNLGLINPGDLTGISEDAFYVLLREKSVRQDEFKAFVTYTEEPLRERLTGELIAFPLNEHSVWDAQGVSELSVSSYDIPPATVKLSDYIIDLLFESYTEPQSANVECAYNQCFPMAIANSLQYLENIFGLSVPHEHVMGLKGDNSLVGQLDTYGNRTVTNRRTGYGMWFTPMINGKFKYLSDNGLSGQLVHKYQGRGWGSTPNQALPVGDFSAFGSTLVDEGATVTYEWIKKQIQDGEDVELIFSYDDLYGNPTGGHAVRVFECGRVFGKPYVKYLHDSNQSNDSSGLETVKVDLVDLDGDGIPNFGSVGREVRFAMSESIKHEEQPTPTMEIVKPTPTPTFHAEKPSPTPTYQIVLPSHTPLVVRPTPTKESIVGPHVYDDLIVSQGFGGQTLVNLRYYNSLTGLYSSIRRSFMAIPLLLQERIGGGQGRATYLASGDLDGDGTPDIVTSFGPIIEKSSYPNLVIVRNSETRRVIGNFFVAFPTGDGTSTAQYNGGDIRAAVGNFTGSKLPQLAVAQGFGGNGIVRLYQYTNNPPPNSWEVVGQFNGLPVGLVSQTNPNIVTAVVKTQIGVTLAAGDIDQDGLDELVVGQTNGPLSQTIFHVLDINGKGGIENRFIYAGFVSKYRGNGGVELQVGDLNGDQYPEIIVGSMGNLRNFSDARDSVPYNLVGVISPIVENKKITGFKRPTGKSVFNAFSADMNPSGAVTLAAGEFDGNPSNGVELAVGTSAFMKYGDNTTTFELPPTDPRYKIFKITFDGSAVNEIQTLGPANGYIAFVGEAVPTSKTIFMAGLRGWKISDYITPTPAPTMTPTPSPIPTIDENPEIKNCVEAGDLYKEETSELSSINLGYVQITEAQLADGTPVPLKIGDCSGDGLLDIEIPWTESTAKQLSTIEFSANICRGIAPKKVDITLSHGTPITLNAYDDAGALVNTVSSSASAVETLSLTSSSGIRIVEMEGAEICILRICWHCILSEITPRPTSTPRPDVTPTPTRIPGIDNCVSASQFYKQTAEVTLVQLGGIEILPAVDPTGKVVPLRITNCAGMDSLDVFIPWTEETASPKAAINLSKDLCDGNLPRTVEIVLKHGNTAIFYAYDGSGALVDKKAADSGSAIQSVVLTSASGIYRIEIVGSEICILRICWGCGEIEVEPTPSTQRTWLSFDDTAQPDSPIQVKVQKSTENTTIFRYHIPGAWQSTVQYGGQTFTRIEFPEVGILEGAGFEEGDEWFQFPKEANYPPLDGNRYRNALSIRTAKPVFPENITSLTALPSTAEEMARLGINPAGARPGIPVLAGLLAVNPIPSREQISIITTTISAKELKLTSPLAPAGYSGLDQTAGDQNLGTTPPELVDQSFYREFKGVYTGPESNFSDISHAGAFSVVEMRAPLVSAQTASDIKILTDIEVIVGHPGGVTPPNMSDDPMIPWDSWVNKPAVINGFSLRDSLINAGIPIWPIRRAHYLILTPSGYTAYLNTFVDWKESRGLHVDVKTVGTAGIADVAADRDAIDQYIEDYYNKYSWDSVYVLIIGDQDVVPAGRSSKIVASPDYSNGDSDHVYAVIGSDRFASVYVGRLSVNGAPSELEAQLNKIMSYERGDVSGNWPTLATLLANSENDDGSRGVSSSHPSKYAAAINDIASYAFYSNPPTFEVMHAGASNNSTPRAVNQDVIDALNAGRGQLMYRGHGSSSSWVQGWDGSSTYGNAFDVSEELPLLSNNIFPIVYSIACQNNRIMTDDSLGESWMSRANAGAAAFWSASVNSYTGENHNRAKGVFRAIYEDSETRLGAVLADAELISWGLTGDSTSWDNNSFCYLLLGDPEMTVRRNRIFTLAVTLELEHLINGTLLKVIDENGSPVPGALVTASLGQSLKINGFTNRNGSLLIEDVTPNVITRFDVFSKGYPWLWKVNTEIIPEPVATHPDPIWVDDDNQSGVEDGSALYPFNTIAEAMTAAATHTIRVRSGNYHENVTMKDGVKLLGAGSDTTTICCEGGSGISCTNVGHNSMIAGFRIQGASIGINCVSSSPVIHENVIVFIDPASLVAHGIQLRDSSPIIDNNVIHDVGGMGIAGFGNSEPQITNNTIFYYRYYAGISFAALDIGSVSPVVKNNIIWRGNDQPVAGVLWRAPASVQVSYNDVYDPGNVTEGNVPSDYAYHDGTAWHAVQGGAGAISADPLFVDADNGLFNLQSDSPCIDAGDPNPIYNDADGSRNDMGAFGGQRLEMGNASHPGSGFLFTSVGRIPIDEIVRDAADPSYGLAVVSATAANDYHIPQYKDSPFGGVLWIRGLFGVNDPVDYYQILVRPATGTATTALNNPLVKTLLVINLDGTVTRTDEHLGPQTIGGVSNLYRLNKEGIWSQEDLRIMWNTAGLNGKYILQYKAYRQTGADAVEEVILPANANDHLTLWLDNTPLDVKINEVLYSDNTGLVECEGIRFPHAGNSQLVFDISANHPKGFLRYVLLDCFWGHDQYGGRFLYDRYEGIHDSPPPFWNGYKDAVLSPRLPVDSGGNPIPWENCAYRFRLYAEGRATDGFNYLQWASSSVYHDVEVAVLAAKQSQPVSAASLPCDELESDSPLLAMLPPDSPIAAPLRPSYKNSITSRQSSPLDAATLTAADFVDSWVNIDPDTLGLTHIKIDRSGGDMIVQAYGKCHPIDCDWGAIAVPYTGNPFTAIYEMGFKTTTLTITLLDIDTLSVHSVNVFHDGSGRDYTSDYTFAVSTIWVDDSNTSGVEDGSMLHPFNTIPEGITAAISGQVVHVLPGLYTLPVLMKNGVSVVGSGAQDTVIDLGGTGTGVYCTGIGANAMFTGFKITNAGTGIYCQSSNLTICENVITNIAYTSVTADGIRLDDSSPIIRNNLIYHVGGMGIRGQSYSVPKIVNNTIYDYGYYAGISFAALNIGPVSPVIKNNIVVRGNTLPVGGILWKSPATPVISYNDVYGVGNVTGTGSFYAVHNGTQWIEQSGGIGAISLDPLFIDAAHGFFYLDSTSPCVDAGDPDALYNDVDGSRNDMGAFGGLRLENSAPFHAATGFVFTGVGKVPITQIVADSGNPSHGLLRVSDTTATALSIPKYTDAAFGGLLYLHGLFGSTDDVDYYQILATPYGTSATAAMSEPLVKTNYTINPDGSITSTRVQMGPLTVGGVDNVYLLNKSGYWNFTDVRYIWNTTGLNGKYTITVKAYRLVGTDTLQEVILPSNELDHFTLRINNQQPEVSIDEITYSDGDPIAECEKILFPHNGDSSLNFTITAWHPEGFMREFSLNAYWGNDRFGGQFIADQYVGSNDGAPPVWNGWMNHTFSALLPRSGGSVMDWHTCAYRFSLVGTTRITDGVQYIHWRNDNVYQSVINAAAQ